VKGRILAKKSKSNNNNTDEKVVLSDYSERKINWYPGHMNRAINEIINGLKKVDIVLEVRDARSPLVTGNRVLKKKIGNKPKLIVINKKNLANPDIVEKWEAWFEKQGEPFIFINCLDKDSLKTLTDKALQILNEKRDSPKKSRMKLMIIGLPNTGKSTIINKLANRNATKAAAKPGQTQTQLWVRVGEDLDLLDTPGVMPPEIDTEEQGIWLSAIHAIPDKVVIPEIPACYIVEHMIKVKSEAFKNHYKLETLGPDLISTLNAIAELRGCFKKQNEYDYERVYQLILNDFRKGDLGKTSFGLPPLNY
tara:strand:- start:225376 stop:226299 length:924 start_codon:yes stop_codon:yes gene_type:complete